ncbi:hypothetical protein [Marinobacter sp. DS40M6]|uniref:hypothetical protein n=1 Tax=Marinobacter sp. DS40M6 TaxID=1597776 RepID=UPI0023582A3B|nr:hypothetical protein [Marinobacter sp. DS40M6]MDC8457847.1 hypothetical protein [Marinobacter sp. DS40M6]
MDIYETHFDPDTKEVTRHSEISDYEGMDEAELMHGEPIVARGSYQVHEGGLMFSTFPWSLPSAAPATSDPVWAR